MLWSYCRCRRRRRRRCCCCQNWPIMTLSRTRCRDALCSQKTCHIMRSAAWESLCHTHLNIFFGRRQLCLVQC